MTVTSLTELLFQDCAKVTSFLFPVYWLAYRVALECLHRQGGNECRERFGTEN